MVELPRRLDGGKNNLLQNYEQFKAHKTLFKSNKNANKTQEYQTKVGNYKLPLFMIPKNNCKNDDFSKKQKNSTTFLASLCASMRESFYLTFFLLYGKISSWILDIPARSARGAAGLGCL